MNFKKKSNSQRVITAGVKRSNQSQRVKLSGVKQRQEHQDTGNKAILGSDLKCPDKASMMPYRKLSFHKMDTKQEP